MASTEAMATIGPRAADRSLVALPPEYSRSAGARSRRWQTGLVAEAELAAIAVANTPVVVKAVRVVKVVTAAAVEELAVGVQVMVVAARKAARTGSP